MNTLPALALYVHMPWCVRKCPYCDFNSHRAPTTLPAAEYIDALLTDLDVDIAAGAIQQRELSSLFMGGGTPSLFSPADVGRLLQGVRSRVACAGDMEVTLEANPGTVERGSFREYRTAGVNRVSLGVQSFPIGPSHAWGAFTKPRRCLPRSRSCVSQGSTISIWI